MVALVIAEHDNASLKSGTLNTITAAAQCGNDVHVLVAGHQCSGAAQVAAAISGVAKVIVADAPQFADGLAENIAEQTLALASGYAHILAPASAFGKNLLPRVAARLDVGQISEIIRVESPDTFDRYIYAGNAIATVQSGDPIKVMTVRTTCFEAAGVVVDSGDSAPVESVAPVAAFDRVRFVSRDLAVSDRPELTSAKIVVAGGRGLDSADDFQLLGKLADKLGAAMGATRAAVDAGFVPNDWQIGQTGKIVAPDLYIAIGISGAVQHIAGIKGAKTIVAINQDEDAPIFLVSDYGLVGNLYELVPQLIAELG